MRTNETNPDGTFNTYNQYGNNTEENLMNHLWIPAGEKRDIGDMDVNTGVLTLFGSEGDTFIQRFDLLKTAPFDTDSEGTEENNSDWNKLWVGISVWIESFINMDGRYDNKRGMTNLYDTKFETFTALNPVYSQKNNFFEYNTLNTNLLNDYEAKSTFAWSSPKTVNELIDS
ncbi:MAG: hypothetical protein LBE56_12730 [Tannerella sp.]|nr:hypothetical protein [Tannerella sp.]